MTIKQEDAFKSRLDMYMDQWRLGCKQHNIAIMSIYDSLIVCCYDLVLEMGLISIDDYNEYLYDYRHMKFACMESVILSDLVNDD